MTEANQKGERMSTVNQSSDTGSSSPRPASITLAIYRDLRVGMVVVMVMLAAAIVVERISATGWQWALSAYYYTSAHSVFIAALLALSTLFFVYQGSSDTEDALLTLAGVCALTAALVPQGRPAELYGRADLVYYDPEPAIQPNVWAVVVALVLGWLLMLWQHRHNHTKQTRSPGGTLSLYFLRLVVVVGLITLVVPPFRPSFTANAHGAAGILMLSAFIATVFCTAYVVGHQEESRHRDRYHRFYRGISVVMLVTLIAVVTAHLLRPDWMDELWIIALETFLILEFAAYWGVQTIELWDTPDRRERLPEDARNRLAEGRTTRGLAGLTSELLEARKDPLRLL